VSADGGLGAPIAIASPARDGLQARWRQALNRVSDDGCRARLIELAESPALRPLLDGVFAGSSFLAETMIAEPALVMRYAVDGADAMVAAALDPAGTQETLERTKVMAELRRRRRRLALVIALEDLSQSRTLEQITDALTRFADFAVEACLAQLLFDARHRGELPAGDSPATSGVIVLAMGKHGAFELNYSSDIDLIVLYDLDRLRYAGRETPMAFCVKLARQLTYMLSTMTRDGYVFRTDLRLRPHLPGHPLALSVDDAEIYFERHGQNWERAAFIKARAIAGDIVAGDSFLKRIQPFIWRRHLDFAAIRDIHSIKRQINAYRGYAEIAVAGHDLKVGRGGIREIEFFAQTQQLILGGRHPQLRSRNTIETLCALADGRWINGETRDGLIASYRLLRDLEHRLQMVADKQTQKMPARARELAQFAAFAGFASVDVLTDAIVNVLRNVERHYAALFEAEPDLGWGQRLVFTGTENDAETLQTLKLAGFDDPSAVCERIRQWHHGHIRSTRSARARELLTELTPSILEALQRQPRPNEAFRLLDAFLTNLPSGVQVFSLIRANPRLLVLLCDIMGAAPRLAETLANNTDLFDTILGADFLDPPPDAASLRAEFEALLVDARQLEDVLDICRTWAHGRQFQFGLQVLLGATDVERANAAHTELAEVVVQALLPRSLAWLEDKHGRIAGGRFAVIAMGKLGSRELTVGSDLDIVFVFDAPPDALSDGAQPLPTATYFARASQRVITAIASRTAHGRLYEIDTRLRPSGNAGPVACSIDNFRRYQLETAETWEHQALTRARPIAGDESLADEVDRAIADALCRPVDPAKVRADIRQMRARIFKEFGDTSPWKLKHVRGGLIDIEFGAQGLQLLHARAHPAIRRGGTGAVIAAAAEAGLVDRLLAERTIATLHLLHALQAVLRLSVDNFDPGKAPPGLREALVRAANRQLELGLPLEHFAGLEGTLVESLEVGRHFFDAVCGSDTDQEDAPQ